MERSKIAGFRLAVGMLVSTFGTATVACSSNDTTTPAPVAPVADAGDGGTTIDAAPPPPDANSLTCGSAPFEELDVQVNQVDVTGTPSPLNGVARIAYTGGCTTLTTDEHGKGHASLSTSTSPRAVKVTPPIGFVPSIFAEEAISAKSGKRTYPVFPVSAKTLPNVDWAEDKGAILIRPNAAGTGACAAADGITYSVEGHPEAIIKYLTSATTVDPTLKATAAYGFATVSKAPPGEKLKIIANKPQCNASTLDANGVGLVPIEAGALSITTATLSDLGGPNCGPGPYVQMTGQALKRTIDFVAAPLAGAAVTWSNCPGVASTTREDGSFGVMMTKDMPFSVSLAKSGVIPFKLGDLQLSGPVNGILVARDEAWKAYEPGWSDTGVSIIVGFDHYGTGACATSDGMSVTVKDHPEAVAHYLDTSVPPAESVGATATTTRGYVELTGLPPGTYQFDVANSKACKVTLVNNREHFTGSLTAVAGATNIIFATIEDP